jgi:hypothetical protein
MHELHRFFVVTDHPIIQEPMKLEVQIVSGCNARHAVTQAEHRAKRMGAALMGVNTIDAAPAAELSYAANLAEHAAQRRNLDPNVVRHQQH